MELMLSKDRYFPATKIPSIGIEQAVDAQVILNFAKIAEGNFPTTI
jgi:hypothetical protein